MKSFFVYLFWPNPAGWHYADTRVVALLVIGFLFVVGSIFLSQWRKKQQNVQTKNLSSGWSTASLWFGLVLLFMTVSRVEQIQFFSMRLAFILWSIVLALYVALQVFQFRRKHYTVLGRTVIHDDRSKYLPRKR